MSAFDTYASCSHQALEGVADVFGTAVAAEEVPDRRAGEAGRFLEQGSEDLISKWVPQGITEDPAG